ncbi:MAG: hypothetical protein L0H70_10370, partial [Xanthomonadales bacterium]|nr:hypothetical protein [Xanthomonadales bacterium]
IVTHLQARQDVDDVDSNGNSTASALEDQEKRVRQAVAVALQVQSLQRTGTVQTSLQPSMLNFSPQLSALPTPLIVVGDFNAYQFTDGFADLVGMISGRYDFDANVWDLSDLTKWNLNPVNPPLTDNNLVNPPLWNAVNSLPENEQYSYLYAPNFGPIQGYGLGGEGSRKVPTDQVLDHALLNTAARAVFVRMDYGRANEDAASEDEKNSTGAIGVSDHDGFVIQLTFDRIFANGFDISN